MIAASIDRKPAQGSCCEAAYPNRQGHLVLGPCPFPVTPLQEPCAPGPAEPLFGIAHCRCLRLPCQAFVDTGSGTNTTPIALRPHDLVRLRLKILRKKCL
jgi:hypothetical protein